MNGVRARTEALGIGIKVSAYLGLLPTISIEMSVSFGKIKNTYKNNYIFIMNQCKLQINVTLLRYILSTCIWICEDRSLIYRKNSIWYTIFIFHKTQSKNQRSGESD